MAGIYIHIPFCKQKCTYCDFHFSTTFSSYRSQLIDALIQEIKLQKNYLGNQIIQTIYFGGGTPSLLEEHEINAIINQIRQNYTVAEQIELTLEANPDDLTAEKIQALTRCGINRLSIGLQSFREEDLVWMNRAHTAEESLACIGLAQENGIHNISIDLIYGLPNLSLNEWKTTIQQAISLGVQHISAYCLTVEEKTALKKWVSTKKLTLSDEDEQAEQFALLIETLQKAGYEQYEISNFALPNFESKHNSSYWKGTHYLGIGPSAHSFNGTSRSWNIAHNRQYIQQLNARTPWFEVEELTKENQFNELVMIGLRTKYGVDIQQLLQIINPLPSEFLKNLSIFKANDWILEKENRLVLTPKGKLKADYIASELFIIS